MSITCENNCYIDPHGNEYEQHCITEASAYCCTTLWCDTHHAEHLTEDHETTCVWCKGTGVYSGPMLNSHYSGPCLVCS